MRESINLDENIKFGCEVEFFSNYNLRELQNLNVRINGDFIIDFDCPLIDLKEAVSPILDVNKLYKLKRLLELLKETRSYTTIATGAHIHFGANIVDDANFFNMLKLWCISEDIIYDFSKGEFEQIRKFYDTYASRMKKDLTPLLKNNNKIESYKYFYKSSGLNLANHLMSRPKKDTYEVRTPNGTINYEIWLNNIDFFGNFLSYANKEESKDLINYYFNNDKDINVSELSKAIFNNDESIHYFNKQLDGFYIKKK